MTHSSHRFTTLSADDVALCRAHSEAIDDARESRALQRWVDAVAPLVTPAMSVRAFEVGNHMPADLPMPPSYWDDLEHWLKTLAPAKPAAEQPEAAVGVWNREDPPIPGVYVACHDFQDQRPQHYAHWSGMNWTITYNEPSSAMEGRRRGNISSARDYLWLRLIEADAPAQQPAQQPAQKASTHSVCIEYHITHGIDRAIGEVLAGHPSERSYPQHWLPCDESGWVTHVPTADSVCPVPDGVGHETKRRCGDIVGSDCSTSLAWQLGHKERRVPHEDDIIAWRPIAQS